MNRADFALGLAFAALGAGIAAQAAGMPSMGKMGVGSGLFPTVTGLGMVLFGLVLAVQSVLTPAAREAGLQMLRWDVAAILALLAALVVLMPTAGFLVTGTVFAAAAARLGGAGTIGAIVFGIAATVLLYAVFVHALGVPLPRGLLGF